MVGHEEVDAAGVFCGPRDGVEEHIEGAVFAGLAEGAAVDEFLQDDVAVGELIESGDGLDAFKVAGVVVEVAGDDEVALAGEAEHVAVAQGVGAVEVSAGVEDVDEVFRT